MFYKSTIIVFSSLVIGNLWAQQVGWPGCEVSADDFTVEKIVTRSKDNAHSPMKIGFHQVGDKTNFYFNELRGKVRYYDEATNSVKDVGEVDGYFEGEKDVFSGLVLDPNFEKNRRIYLYFSRNGNYRMARYNITPDNKLDNSSEKVFFDIPKNNNKWHSAGAMAFDTYGDLWLGVGDNQQYQKTGLATNNYLASIIRIHPDDSPKGYSIPEGNFGPYWAQKFQEMGEPELAAEYADPTKVLPEIYAKGVRQPYTLKIVHPTKRWVAFGDVGPDIWDDGITEEFNILQKPGFLGWAVWAGENAIEKYSGGVGVNHDGITQVPESISKGGASGLPPIIDAQYSVEKASAMSGPIYWYDGTLKSSRKFPAYYHGKWFVGDWDSDAWDGAPWVRVLTMNADYTKTESFEPFFEFTKEKIQEIYFGPDGAMYIAYFYKPWYGDSNKNEIVRISYKGGNAACLPSGDELRPPFDTTPTSTSLHIKPQAPKVVFKGWNKFTLREWRGTPVRLYDVTGKNIPIHYRGEGIFQLKGAANPGFFLLKTGVHVVKITNIQ